MFQPTNDNLFIYALVDPDTDEVRYIGKSGRGFVRPNEQIRQVKHPKTHKERWINKLFRENKKPKIEIIRYCLSEVDLNVSEMEFIKYYKSIGANLTNGTRGGEGGDTGGGQKRKRSVISVNIKNGIKKRYEFVLETYKDGFHPSKVVAVCKGKRFSHLGHYFYYEGDVPNIKKSKCKSPILVKNKTTGEIEIFNSIRDAAEKLKISVSSIANYLKNVSKNPTLEFSYILEGQKHNLIKIFDEEKTWSEWVKDDRCKVNIRRFRQRVLDGWSKEEALTTPVNKKYN